MSGLSDRSIATEEHPRGLGRHLMILLTIAPTVTALLPSSLRPPPTPRPARARALRMQVVPQVRTPPNVLQSEAIRSTRDSVLVLASAGTGKTRVLRSRIAYLLLSEHVPSDRILTVCLLYTSPSPRDRTRSRMPSSA